MKNTLQDFAIEANRELEKSKPSQATSQVCQTAAFPIPDIDASISKPDLEQILSALANTNILYTNDIAQDITHNNIRRQLGLAPLTDTQEGFAYAISYMTVSNISATKLSRLTLPAWQWDIIMRAIALSALNGPKKMRSSFSQTYEKLTGERVDSLFALDKVSCSGCGMAVDKTTATTSEVGYRCPLC